MNFNYKINAKTWEGLAKDDALWSILTDNNKQGERWDIKQFFDTGKNEISVVFSYLEQNNLLPSKYNKAIDFGCGVGRLSRFMASYFKHTTGIDVSATMVEKANVLNQDLSQKLSFVQNLHTNLDFIDDNSISFLYSSIVLQHIPPPEGLLFIEQFLKKLEVGGIAVFQVPTKDIRQVGMVKKLREKIKLRQKLAVIGLVKGYQMEMNVYNIAAINEIAKQENCTVLAQPLTNHTLPDFNGDLQFLSASECEDYESNMFVLRKKAK